MPAIFPATKRKSRLLELAEELEAKAVALETPQVVIPRATRP
jgi:hypothetical protein